MKSPRTSWLPAAVLAAGLLATTALVAVRPEARPVPPESRPPLVRIVTAAPRAVRLEVRAQGTVEPRTESELVAEVSGRVVWIAPALELGGSFGRGEPLVRIERADYEAALERARAAVERASSRLSLARATLDRRRSLRDAGAGSAASLDEAQASERVAAADLRDAAAAQRQAELDLARTELVAPFQGRARAQHVELGGFVARGAPLARLYAVDQAEVRLPIPSEEMAYLDLPLGWHEVAGHASSAEVPEPEPAADAAGASDAAAHPEPAEEDAPAAASPRAGPRVVLSATFAGETQRWEGRVVRTEGALDPKTRMVHVVARVDDPYGAAAAAGRPPLAVGLFVDARIEGRLAEGVFELPRRALRGRDELVVVDEEGRVRRRRVGLLRVEGERVLVADGLRAGERVLVDGLDLVVDGMAVRTEEAAGDPAEAS